MSGTPSNWFRSTPYNPLYHQMYDLLLSCVDPPVIDLDPLLIIPLSSEIRFIVFMSRTPSNWSRSTPDNPLYHQREDILLSCVDWWPVFQQFSYNRSIIIIYKAQMTTLTPFFLPCSYLKLHWLQRHKNDKYILLLFGI